MSMTKFCGIDFKEYLYHLGESSTGHNKLTLLKELIDNSLDANATHIKIYKQENVQENSIIIQDNGDGMDRVSLFRCIQFYSKNVAGKTGKFGIGGSTALVNLSKYNDTFGKLFIFTRNQRGESLSLHIDWNQYNSMSDFEKAVNASLKSNCVSDSRLLDDFEHGTYIKIDTDCDKIEEYLDEINTCFDLSISYYYFLKQGVIIDILGEQVLTIELKHTYLKESIDIDIYQHKKKYGYSSKIGRQTLCYRYDKSTKRETKCHENDIDHWKLIGQLTFILICPAIYNGSTCYTKKHQVSNVPEIEQYCREMGVEDSDIPQCQKEYLMPLYISRQAEDTTRILGGLPIHSTYNYLYKEVSFHKKYDESLGLVQQNKSCIEWNNSPPYLQEYLELIVQTCIKTKLTPIYKKLDKIYKEKINEQKVIQAFITNHVQRCLVSNCYNPYLLEDIILACEIIQTTYRKYYNLNKEMKYTAATIIKNWYIKSCQQYLNGESKIRKFFIWAYNYDLQTCAILKIQQLYRRYIYTIKTNRLQNHAATIITQTFSKQWSRFKYINALLIQTCYRRYKSYKHYASSYKRIKKQLKLSTTMREHNIHSLQELDHLIEQLTNFRKKHTRLI